MSNVTTISGTASPDESKFDKEGDRIIVLGGIAAIADLISVVAEYDALGGLDDNTIRRAVDVIRDMAEGALGGAK